MRPRHPRKAEPVYVYVLAPRCPACGSKDLHTRHTDQNGDGTVTRHTVCRACGRRFRLVVE